MTTPAPLYAKKVLVSGGAMYLRTEIDHITRFARVVQGPGGHERTIPTGSMFSITLDSSWMPDDEIHVNPFAVALKNLQKVYVSRVPIQHVTLPTAFSFFLEGNLARSSASKTSDAGAPSVLIVPNNSEVATWKYSSWSFWYEWAKWLVVDGRHAPGLVTFGKGLQFTSGHPLISGPLALISTVWAFHVLNISFLDMVIGDMQTVWIFGRNIARRIGDYFEGHPAVRLTMGLVIIYVCFLLLSALGFCIGSFIICSMKKAIRMMLLGGWKAIKVSFSKSPFPPSPE